MLRRKNGVLYLRKIIPESLRSALGGRREIKISLRTRDPELAKTRWKLAGLRVDAMLDAARRGVAVSLPPRRLVMDDESREAFESYLATALERDEDGTRPLPPVTRGRYLAHFTALPEGTTLNPLLSVALAQRERELQPTGKTGFQWTTAFTRFRNLACGGVDLPVASITRAHCVAFKNALLSVPAKGRKRTIAATTATKDVNVIKALLGYAVAQGWITVNPAAGLTLVRGTTGKSDRLPYTTEEARALLDAAEKLEGANRWLPLLLAYTGCRLAEAAGLRCEDVKELDGVWCFSIEDNAARRVKTASSRRVVPVHSALIDAGFLAYHASQHGRLFPTVKADAYGSVGSAWGKYYSRWSRKIVPDRRKVAHSWRHTVATKLRQAEVREDVMDQLLGWTSAKMNRRYGAGHSVATLKEAVERIRY